MKALPYQAASTGNKTAPYEADSASTSARVAARSPWYVEDVLTFLIILGTLSIGIGPLNLSAGDAVLPIAASWAAVTLIGRDVSTPVWNALSRTLPWLVTIVATAIVGAALHGSSQSQILSVAKTTTAILYFIVPLALFAGRRTPPVELSVPVARALAGATALCTLASISVLLQPSERPSGIFPNPVHSATWIACALILTLDAASLPRFARITVMSLGAAAVYQSQSFAVLLALTLIAVVRLVRRSLTTHSLVWLGVLVLAAVGTLALLGTTTILSIVDPAQRSEDSSAYRHIIWNAVLNTWGAHPLGLGPGEFSNQAIVGLDGSVVGFETHNDYLALLVELGPIAVLAFLGALVAAWRIGRRTTRSMTVLFAVVAGFHNSFNFRHMWLMLALALLVDLARDNQSQRHGTA